MFFHCTNSIMGGSPGENKVGLKAVKNRALSCTARLIWLKRWQVIEDDCCWFLVNHEKSCCFGKEFLSTFFLIWMLNGFINVYHQWTLYRVPLTAAVMWFDWVMTVRGKGCDVCGKLCQSGDRNKINKSYCRNQRAVCICSEPWWKCTYNKVDADYTWLL